MAGQVVVDALDRPRVAVRLDEDKHAEAHVEKRDELLGVALGEEEDMALLHDEPRGEAPDADEDVKDDDVDGDFGAAGLGEEGDVGADVVAAVDEGDGGDFEYDAHARGVCHLQFSSVAISVTIIIVAVVAVKVATEEQINQTPPTQQHREKAQEPNRLRRQGQRYAKANHADDGYRGEPDILTNGDVKRRHAIVGGRLGEKGDEDKDVVNVGGGKGAARRSDGGPELHGDRRRQRRR